MAAKDDGDLEMEGKGDTSKEKVLKGTRTRGRTKKIESGTAEAAAMKRFLGNKAENLAFARCAKVIYSPEKKAAENTQGMGTTGDKEESDSIDGKKTRKDSDSEKDESGTAGSEGEGEKDEPTATMDGAVDADEEKKIEEGESAAEVEGGEAWSFWRDKVVALEALVEQVREDKYNSDREIKLMKE